MGKGRSGRRWIAADADFRTLIIMCSGVRGSS